VTSKAAKCWLTRIKKGQALYDKGFEGNKIWCNVFLFFFFFITMSVSF
jgi:hypothetical protein